MIYLKSKVVRCFRCVLLIVASSFCVSWEYSDQWVEDSWKAVEKLKYDQKFEDFNLVGWKIQALRERQRDNLDAIKLAGEFAEIVTSIPGHAQAFGDEIERERATVVDWPVNVGPRVSYDSNRSRYFQILSNLHSPEAIGVLGSYLSDDRDAPPPPKPGQDWRSYPVNSMLAAETLLLMGLRNPPVAKARSGYQDAETLAKSRNWWEEVRSGQRGFSFEGQNVSYRFKPDGSVETTPLPVSEQTPVVPPNARESQAEKSGLPAVAAQVESGPEGRSRTWLWISGGVLAALAAALGLRAKRSAGSGPQ